MWNTCLPSKYDGKVLLVGINWMVENMAKVQEYSNLVTLLWSKIEIKEYTSYLGISNSQFLKLGVESYKPFDIGGVELEWTVTMGHGLWR